MAGPLEGVRILEMGQLIAIPWSIKMLADMGAQVIRLESCQRLEVYRRSTLYRDKVDGEYWNRGGLFYEHNRNKLGITLNLADETGRAVLRDLVAVSDVFAENFTPRVIKNFQLEYDDLRKIRPDIIMVSSTGYGFTGPWANFGATGPSTEGASGLAFMTGYKDGPPVQPEIPYADYTGGEITVFAIMAALMHRMRTGEGQFIDVSQAQATSSTVPEALMDYAVNDRIAPRIGNGHPSMSPHGCYPCRGADRWITIAAQDDQQWQAVCRVLGKQEWLQDGRFATMARRLEHQSQLDLLVGEETKEWEPNRLMHRLQAEGVAAGAVLDTKNVLFNEHLKDRKFYQVVEHDPSTEMPPLPYAGQPWKFSATPNVPNKAAPTMGEHNRLILGELLCRTADELAALEEQGIIGYAPTTIVEPPIQPPLDEQVRQGRVQRFDPDFQEQIARHFEIK